MGEFDADVAKIDLSKLGAVYRAPQVEEVVEDVIMPRTHSVDDSLFRGVPGFESDSLSTASLLNSASY